MNSGALYNPVSIGYIAQLIISGQSDLTSHMTAFQECPALRLVTSCISGEYQLTCVSDRRVACHIEKRGSNPCFTNPYGSVICHAM